MAPDSTRPASDQARLIAALRTPSVFGDGCEHVSVLETHISYVLLTGKHAYKIKKSVSLGFLDFTTLAARRFYCEQELKLNRRLAPALYLDVVAITGTIDAPILGGDGPALEYAVKMREFPQEALASLLLSRNELGAADIDVLAAKVSAFHATIEVAGPDSAFGRPDDVLRFALQNFSQIRPLLGAPAERADLDALALWAEHEHKVHYTAFSERQRGGFIRECHGDLHLGNIARIDGEITIFDCIEFNDAMRWIDVMSEVAFTVMDLQDRGRGDLGQRFLNAYLEITGITRACRSCASISRIARWCGQTSPACAPSSSAPATRAEPSSPNTMAMSISPDPMHNHRRRRSFSHMASPGPESRRCRRRCWKSLGAVRIRTDVERKRLHGLGPRERSPAGIDRGLYAPDATEATYQHVCTLARGVAAAGHVALVDATFLKRWQRDLFRKLASNLQVPFVIVTFAASESTLRERITRRAIEGHDASDANLAVLDHQLRVQEPLAPEERADVFVYGSEAPRLSVPMRRRPGVRLSSGSPPQTVASQTPRRSPSPIPARGPKSRSCHCRQVTPRRPCRLSQSKRTCHGCFSPIGTPGNSRSRSARRTSTSLPWLLDDSTAVRNCGSIAGSRTTSISTLCRYRLTPAAACGSPRTITLSIGWSRCVGCPRHACSTG